MSTTKIFTVKLFLSVALIGLTGAKLAAASTNGYQLSGCTDQDVADAKASYEILAGEVQQGRLSTIDERTAEAFFLDTQHCRGTITLEDYCSKRTAGIDALRRLYLLRGMLPSDYFRDLVEVRSRCTEHGR